MLLVQAIADTDWRLSRIPQLILGIQAKARHDMADSFPDLMAADRALRLEVEGFLKYEKQIRNLQLQESRLHRRREKDSAELRTLIAGRQTADTQQLAEAAELYLIAREGNEAFDPSDFGFDFSTDEIQFFLNTQPAVRPADEVLIAAKEAA